MYLTNKGRQLNLFLKARVVVRDVAEVDVCSFAAAAVALRSEVSAPLAHGRNIVTRGKLLPIVVLFEAVQFRPFAKARRAVIADFYIAARVDHEKRFCRSAERRDL